MAIKDGLAIPDPPCPHFPPPKCEPAIIPAMNRSAETPSQGNSIPLVLACCILLGAAEYSLYHVNFHQFFQGDAVFWMYYRFRSAGEFLRGLVNLDVAHWYRPLSSRTIPSLLYPILGLRPYGYHLVVFACFFATTCAVLLFLRSISGKLSTAFLGAFYFSIHSIDIYTTYDFAFSPEVFYVFFYVCTVWFFLKGERQRSPGWRAASVVCCVLTLMSKEAAATFPAMLFVAHLLFVGGGVFRALKAIALHTGVWIAYLVYVVGYLGVGGGDYMLVVHTNVLHNLLTGVFYALNLRRDGWMPTRAAPNYVFLFLVVFAVVLLTVGVRLLFRKQRSLIVFGVLWFVIGLAPMLMLNGLGPYYVFLALVGFALIVGVSLDYLREQLISYSLWLSRAGMAAILVMFWVSCHSVLAADTAGDIALGFASRWAGNSVSDMLQARPKLPPGTKIYFLNDSVPDLWRFHGIGNLFKLVYNDESIVTAYRSLGQDPKAQAGDLVVMQTAGDHLVEVTAAFKADPEKYLGAVDESRFKIVEPPGVSLRVEPTEAVAGRDFYWLVVEGLGSDDLVVQYTLDDGPVAEARFRLSPEGKIRFFLSDFTPVGVFHFIRFRAFASPATEWIRADASLRVLPPLSGQH